MINIVAKAVKKAGGVTSLARKLGIKHNAFYVWKRVPAERVLKIERITGISRHDLRPDLYPLPSKEETAAWLTFFIFSAFLWPYEILRFSSLAQKKRGWFHIAPKKPAPPFQPVLPELFLAKLT